MREKESHTTLLFVRHGIPDYPESRIYARDDDPGLTPEGQAQAAALGRWVKSGQVDAVYVSPTRRTRETVAPMAEALGMAATEDARLEERHFGVWEGLDFDTIRDQHGDDFQAWKSDPIGFAPQGGENILQMALRVGDGLADIRARHPGDTVLVVSHVGTMRIALCDALTAPLAAYRRFNIATGSVARVDYGKRQANLMYLGMVPGGTGEWSGGDL